MKTTTKFSMMNALLNGSPLPYRDEKNVQLSLHNVQAVELESGSRKSWIVTHYNNLGAKSTTCLATID